MAVPEDIERDILYLDGQAHFSWFGAHKPIIEAFEQTTRIPRTPDDFRIGVMEFVDLAFDKGKESVKTRIGRAGPSR